MLIRDQFKTVNRRSFMGVATMAAGCAVTPLAARSAMAGPVMAAPSHADATMLRMARDLFPHERLDDGFYKGALETMAAQLGEDPALSGLLASGIQLMDETVGTLHGQKYFALASDAARAQVLHAIEDSAFFAAVHGGLITALYNQQPLWERFGYQGSSAEFGGYLHRGFDDIDWLPA